MAVTVEWGGDVTATLTTEHTISGAAITGAKTLICHVNTQNLVNGETVELRAYAKVATGDSTPPNATLLIYSAVYQHDQGTPVKVSIPITSAYSAAFTLTQTGGTGRVFTCRIDSV